MIHSYLKPSPFKIGCLVVAAALCLFYLFGSRKPQLLTSFDNRLTDVMFTIRGKTPISGQVVIVDIDDGSLARIGQWPWPRNIVAGLVAQIHGAGARVIGFDMVFAEPDRTSPKNHLDGIIDLLSSPVSEEERNALRANPALDFDLILGDTLAAMPSVLGYVFRTTPQAGLAANFPFPSCTIRLDPPATPLSAINFIQASNAIVNVTDVSQGESEGFFNVFPDPSGTIRKVPLFMALNGVPYPSLALETMRIGLKQQEVTIHLSQQVATAQKGILGITVAGRFIPTDDQGQLTVNYRGPVKSFAYVPAAEVLAGRNLDRLRDKYVLIGTSAAGLLDLRATPFANIFPGVEIQATVMDNLLAGDPLTYDLYTEIGMTYALVAGSGLLLSALLAYATPLAGALAGLLCLLATAGGSYFFFLNNKIIGITYPLLTIITVFLVVTLSNYFFAGREKRFLRDAFGHYVSPDVVSELIKNPANLSLSGQVRNLTVFFSDIRDFTTISEKMTPIQLGRFMNRYLTAMSAVLLEQGGTVDKYIGDAIMAIWGAPLAASDHAARAVRASLASIKRLERLQEEELQKEQAEKIEIGIGLNTGEMNVGNFGSTQRFDYTVIGDNVNLASRLEGLTKVYGCRILISEATRDAAGSDFFCRFIDRVRVKGKKLPVNIFEPLCEGEPDGDLRREVASFQQAITVYQQRDFIAARQIMSQLHEKNNCKLYRLYLERIDVFLSTPPPPDWDGVFVFTSK